MSPEIRFHLSLDQQRAYVDGHFDGHPIVPGAVSLNEMLKALEKHRGRPMPGGTRIRNFKCLNEFVAPFEACVHIHSLDPQSFHLELRQADLVLVSSDVLMPSSE